MIPEAIIVLLNIVILLLIVIAFAIFMTRQESYMHPYIDAAEDELKERRENHSRGWRELHARFNDLVSSSRKNRLASEYQYARTKLLAAKEINPEEDLYSYSLAIVTGMPVPITEALGVFDDKVAKALLLTYPSIDAIIGSSDSDLAKSIGASTDLIERLKNNISKRINPHEDGPVEQEVIRAKTDERSKKKRQKRFFWKNAE